MNGWRCSKRDCDFHGTGEPNNFNGMFYCPKHDPRNNWIVIGYDTHDSYRRGPFEVGEYGRNVKDVQDSIAEYAGDNPHIIYSVVRESDFRNYYRDILRNFFGK